MKYLLLLMLIIGVVRECSSQDILPVSKKSIPDSVLLFREWKPKSVVKNYYYYWEGAYLPNARDGQCRYAWGENDVCLDHKPTKAEVMVWIKGLFKKNDPYVQTIKIDVIEETGRDVCIVPDRTDTIKLKAF